MSFPDLFKRGCALWWRTRGLWLLGMLAALFGGSDYTTSSLNFESRTGVGDELPPGLEDQIVNNPLLRSIAANPVPWIVGLIAVALVWVLLAILIGQLAQGAMIRMADRADRGYPAPLGDALRTGAARLLPMFLLGVLLALPLLLIVGAVIGVVLVLVATIGASVGNGAEPTAGIFTALGGLLLCIVPLILLMLAASLAISLFTRTAQCACVLEGRGPIQSLRRAWGLVTRNFGNTLLTWLSTAIMAGLFSFVASLPILAVGIPAMIRFLDTGAIPWGVVIGAGIYSLLVTVLIGGWLTSLNFALWTVMYRSFAAREQPDAVPASYAPGD